MSARDRDRELLQRFATYVGWIDPTTGPVIKRAIEAVLDEQVSATADARMGTEQGGVSLAEDEAGHAAPAVRDDRDAKIERYEALLERIATEPQDASTFAVWANDALKEAEQEVEGLREARDNYNDALMAIIERPNDAYEIAWLKAEEIAAHLLENDRLRAELAVFKRAVDNATYCLTPNQGEQSNMVLAHKWLRTTFPPDHPNYVNPDDLPKGWHDEH